MGARVVLLRDPARAQATVHALQRVGLEAACTPLVFTVWPEDTSELKQRVGELAAGAYDWLVLTSVTTVKAVHQLLAGVPLPPALQLAAVGTSTAQAAQDLLGIPPAFTPEVQSAAGLCAQWRPAPGARICYPHGDLASSTLGSWLAAQPVHATEATAYRTVADARGLALIDTTPAPADVPVLLPGQLAGHLAGFAAAIFTAPSIVRRFAELAGGRPEHLATVAIGQPTARQLQELGWPVHAIAETPTPEGLARAAVRALAGISHHEFLATRTGE